MHRIMLKSKINHATITDACLEYEGSLTVDGELLEAANLLPGERVQVVNLNNGNRLETYLIEGERGKKDICLNGAAARTGLKGDRIIILAYGLVSEEEARSLQPAIVFLDGANTIKRIEK